MRGRLPIGNADKLRAVMERSARNKPLPKFTFRKAGGWAAAPGSKLGRERKRSAQGWIYRDKPGGSGVRKKPSAQLTSHAVEAKVQATLIWTDLSDAQKLTATDYDFAKELVQKKKGFHLPKGITQEDIALALQHNARLHQKNVQDRQSYTIKKAGWTAAPNSKKGALRKPNGKGGWAYKLPSEKGSKDKKAARAAIRRALRESPNAQGQHLMLAAKLAVPNIPQSTAATLVRKTLQEAGRASSAKLFDQKFIAQHAKLTATALTNLLNAGKGIGTAAFTGKGTNPFAGKSTTEVLEKLVSPQYGYTPEEANRMIRITQDRLQVAKSMRKGGGHKYESRTRGPKGWVYKYRKKSKEKKRQRESAEFRQRFQRQVAAVKEAREIAKEDVDAAVRFIEKEKLGDVKVRRGVIEIHPSRGAWDEIVRIRTGKPKVTVQDTNPDGQDFKPVINFNRREPKKHTTSPRSGAYGHGTTKKSFTVPAQRYVIKADKIPGGLADKKKPSDFDKEKLAAGIKVELEHTDDRGIATEIAMDHLTEDPRYYEKLAKIEKALYIGKRGGKWADPQHTIPYKEPKGRRRGKKAKEKAASKPKQEVARTEVESTRHWVQGADYGLQETKAQYTDSAGNYTKARLNLHATVMGKFLDKVPSVPSTQRPVALVTMGGPASGKGTLLRAVAGDTSDFVTVNPDDVKDELPEYQKGLDLGKDDDGKTISARDAAWLAHEESSDIAVKIHQDAMKQRKNIVLDGTGKNAAKYERKIKELRDAGYQIKVLMPHVPMEEAVTRVEQRAERTGRYVPEDIVRHAHGVIPGNFERIARNADEFALFNNDSPPAPPPKQVWSGGADKEDTFEDPQFVAQFKQLGTQQKAASMSKSEDNSGDAKLPPSVSMEEILKRIADASYDEEDGTPGDKNDGVFRVIEDYEEETKAALDKAAGIKKSQRFVVRKK